MAVRQFEHRELLVDALVSAAAEAIAAELEVSETVRVGVSGGRSPVAVFEQLGEVPMAWERVEITLVDERLVPVDDPRSNQGLVEKTLLSGTYARKASFLPLQK